MKIGKLGFRPTWAEVNLNNLAYNFNQIKKTLLNVKVMVCVKADAYGHGILAVSKTLAGCGADYLGVASIDEGIKIRKAGIKTPVLVLGLVLKNDILPLFNYNLAATVCCEEFALALDKMARLKEKTLNIHIKVDTGMGRIGILYKDALAFINKIHKLKNIKLEGLFTHLACADVNNKFTVKQIELFDKLVRDLEESGIHIPLIHVANSMGVISYKRSHFNMARPGLIVYGLYPKENLSIKLKPVLSLKTKVIYKKRVPAGYGISYGHTYVTAKETTIVTLPIGYGDGYPRNLSNLAPVLIRGRRFKITGRICMDQMMVDVGNLKVAVADEAVLIGSQGKNEIKTEELAQLSKTIPYEIVCGLGNRIPRIYIK